MVSYPAEFPLSASVEIVNIVRSGKLGERKADLAYNLWILQGYALKHVLGDPTVKPQLIDEELDPIALLEKLNTAAQQEATIQFVIPWLFILKWAVDELLDTIGES